MIPEFYIDLLACLMFAIFLAWRYMEVPKEKRVGLAAGAVVVGMVTLFVLFTYHLAVPVLAQRLNCTVSYFSVSCPVPKHIGDAGMPGPIDFNDMTAGSYGNAISSNTGR